MKGLSTNNFAKGFRKGFLNKLAGFSTNPRSMIGNKQFKNLKKSIASNKFRVPTPGKMRVPGSVVKPKVTA